MADETPRDDEELAPDEKAGSDEPHEDQGAADVEPGAQGSPPGEHRILEDPEPDPDAPPPPATYAGRREQERAEPEEERPADEEPAEDAEPAGDEEKAQAGETVEADTVGLADREAAKEAALQGIRNRTAEQTSKRQRSTGQIPAGATAPAAPGAEADAGGEDGRDADAEGAAGAAAGEPPAPVPVAAVAADTEEENESGRGLWPRFVAASLVVVISMATATAVSLLVYLTDIAKGLGGLPGIEDKLEAVEGGKPQNFLILGSDVRPTDADRGRSDTTILMRIDPEKDLISLFSLPRDLKVNIPGHGVERLNAAYTYGGPKLTLETVKQLTGVKIHHVVNVDFLGFADAVNAIDCVYIDVDRHYFNDNTGVAFEDQYAEIDIEAGYQRLCGLKALQYVRYRHEDNDLVRSARQQDFLREARQGVPPGKLLADRNDLIDIFKKYTTSDIDDLATLVDLFKLLLAARNAPVEEIQFKGDIGGPTSSYVTASNEQIRTAVAEFMAEGEGPGDSGNEKPDEPKKPDGDEPKPDKPERSDKSRPADLVDSTGAGQLYADAVNSKDYDEPIYYPAQLNPGGEITDDSRAIKIDGPAKEVYYGYKLVVAFQALGYTAYYGVSGTDWKDPPILREPSETRRISGTEYLLFYDGGRLRMVGWKDRKASYWVTNTLGQLLSEKQMLGIATGTRKVDG